MENEILSSIYGTMKENKCQWCNTIIYTRKYIVGSINKIKYIFCDKDCKQDYYDWEFICNGIHRKTKKSNYLSQKVRYKLDMEYRQRKKESSKLYNSNNKEKIRRYYLINKEKLAKIRLLANKK